LDLVESLLKPVVVLEAEGGSEVKEQVEKVVVQVQGFGMDVQGSTCHAQSYPMVQMDLAVQAAHPHCLEEADPL